MTGSLMDDLQEAVRLQQAGSFDQSDALLTGVLREAPDNLDALQLLAVGKFTRGLHRETLAALEPALGFYPESFELNILAGHSWRALGELERALTYYVQASEANPAFAECHIMIGWTARALGRGEEAAEHYRKALSLNPNLAEAHNNLGVIHHDQGELEEAIAQYRGALTLQPDHIDARRNLASALRALKRPEEALEAFETLLLFKPDHAYAVLMVAHMRRELCEWRDYDAMATRVNEIAVKQPGTFAPFLLFNWPVSPQVLRATAETYAARFAAPTLPPAAPKAFPRKLRIGYFSADFREHVVARIVPEVLEHHDRVAFDILAYSYGPDDGSAERRRIQAACTQFTDIRELSDDDAARKMREDGVDILVDMNGYTGNIRHGIPARRPAPVQVAWLGYPGTTGSPATDYLIADKVVVPESSRGDFSEKIIYLPGSFQPNAGMWPIADRVFSRAELGLPSTGFVFCSFNSSSKITPHTFDRWMRILKRAENSVLLLYADNARAAENLKKEATARGVSPARLIFCPRLAVPEYLARLRTADLFLDTLPYNAGTTAADALWAGLPVLTLAGETFAGRIAASLLSAVGLPDLINKTPQDYEDMAVELAGSSARFSDVKHRLAQSVQTAAHFDTRRFSRQLEDAYLEAWNIYMTGRQPRHFTVGEHSRA